MADTRRKLSDEFWALVEPSTEAYGDAIDRLMGLLTIQQLEDFVAGYRDEDEDPDADDEEPDSDQNSRLG